MYKYEKIKYLFIAQAMFIFIMSFIEIKLAFDNDSEKSLDSREDLVNFYNGKNRLKGQFDYIKTL